MNEPAGSTPGRQLEFLTSVQRILNEGSFVASYKYALTMAIAEICVERNQAPDGTVHIPLHEISERFIGFYWRQAAPFAQGVFLRHATGREATAVTKIRAFQQLAPTLARARLHRRWPRLVQSISRLLVGMPLWRLQLVGAGKLEFLYREGLVDDGIVLLPGIAQCFRDQFTVVQALVQIAWLGFIQRLPANQHLLGNTVDLADFLFGSERSPLKVIVSGLRDLQHGECFYCRRALHERTEVDHFIAWSRYPRDLGHNFVLAHGSCNLDKREMLPAAVHLEHWAERNVVQGAALQQVLDEASVIADLDASLTVVEWQYEIAERVGAQVWLGKKGQTEQLARRWRDLIAR